MNLSQGVYELEQELYRAQGYITLLRSRIQYFCDRTGDYGRTNEEGVFYSFLDAILFDLEDPNQDEPRQEEMDALQQVTMLEQQNQQLKNQLATMERDDQEKWLDLERQIVDARNEQTECSECKEQKDTIATLMQTIRNLEDKMEQCKLECRDTQQTYDLQERMLKQMGTMMDNQDGKIEALQVEVKRITRLRDAGNKKVQVLEKTLSGMKNQREEALAKTAQMEVLVTQVQKHRDEMQHQLAVQNSKLACKDQHCETLRKTLVDERKKKAKLGKALSTIRNEVAALSE